MTSTSGRSHGTLWNLGISSYWFASSFKWFLLMGALLSERVNEIVAVGGRNEAYGLVVLIGSLEAAIGPILVGYWSDRVACRWGRRRPFLAVGAGLTVVALMALYAAPSLPMLILAFLLLQVADDFGTAPYSALIPDLVPEEHRGRSSGIMALLQQLAQIAAAVAGLALGGKVAMLFAVIAALNVVCALITLRTAQEPPAKRGALQALSWKRWIDPWLLPDFRWVWFTRFLNAVGFYCIQVYIKNFLEDEVRVFQVGPLTLDSPFKAYIFLALIISLVGAVSAVLAGKRSDQIGRKRIIRMAGALMFCVLVPFAFVQSYATIVALGAVFAVGYGAYLSADWALVSDILPDPATFARDMGMWSLSVPLGQSLAGALGGAIEGFNARSPGLGYMAMFLFASACFLASTELVRRIKGSS